jgi:pimeloyl-ACP methyl ester carboxylesterase
MSEPSTAALAPALTAALKARFFGNGPQTVVILHGELDDQRSWRAIAEALAANYRVLTYDRTALQSIEDHAHQLLALLDEQTAAPLHLIAHSGGGLIACRAVALAPARFLSLTLSDSLGQADAAFRAKTASVLAALEAGGPLLALAVARPWLSGGEALAKAEALAAANPEQYQQALLARAATIDPAHLAATLRYVHAYGDQRKWLRAIPCPVLVLVGSDDLLTPMRYSHEIVEWVKHGVLVTITGGGHNAPLEKSAEFLRIVGGFLERHQDFVAGPNDWQDDEEDKDDGEDDGAEMHDYS